MNKKLSLLFPKGEENFRMLSPVAYHDLGIDFICQKISEKSEERQRFSMIFSKMSDDPEVTEYRCAVFDDVYKNPEMCAKLMEVLEHINYEKQYSGFSGHYEESDSAWELLHRLEEISDYVKSVEALQECFAGYNPESEGINNLKAYVNQLYSDNGFTELKKDIQELKASTRNLKSITVGINLNEKFEAHGIGLISFNKKEFTKSSAVGNFVSKLASKEALNEENWNDDFKYQEITAQKSDIFEKIISMAGVNDPRVENSTFYMDKIANSMIGSIVHKLKATLKKYVYLPVTDITELIPEFVFYIRFADYIRGMQEKGFKFARAKIAGGKDKIFMDAKGIYNFKLLSAFAETSGPGEIVPNDLIFDRNNLCYILTGANRGGKTTITQAVGLLFVLAQAGIYIPGEYFEFNPVDSIFSHFPADEDKTMDLGRLGEECKRFKELYSEASETSLLLLNETYSTTSFEEGYYIAKDSVRAILKKGIRTIYNTHMHKLAFDIPEINNGFEQNHAASLVVKAKNGQRSFKVEVAPPEGESFAKDIAEKYGVTFEMLTSTDNKHA